MIAPAPLIAPDGTQTGDPIPGSRYFRDFCPRCKTPMRVTEFRAVNRIATYCSDCSPPEAATRVGNHHESLNHPDADWDAYASAPN